MSGIATGEKRKKDKIPVTVLTGFLGAGKTTLMNHILQSPDHGMRFAIIENEFGDVGVDEKIIQEATDEAVIEVMNGCICCTVRGDLVQALKRMAKRVADFDGVIIETTGLADPAPVAQTFFVDDEIASLYKLDGIITVVDSKHILDHILEEKPEGVENEAQEQVAFADRVLLNKTDLVDEAMLKKVEETIKGVNKTVEIVRCSHCKVDPKKLINLGAFDLNKVLEMEPDFLDTEGEHQHDLTVSSTSVRFEGELVHDQLRMWISELIQTKSADLFRYKGVLAVKGMKEKFVFQGVHMLFSGGFDNKILWKKDDVRECRFVFIGRNLDKEALKAGVEACVAKPLRFNVGDIVVANVGEWVKGKILKQWDDGNPYRIELQDAQKTNVWGPIDNDNFIRKA